MSTPQPPATPFPTVEQLARIAAALASRSGAPTAPAELSAAAWDLWVACGAEIQTRFKEQIERQAIIGQPVVEEEKPDPPTTFPADLNEVLQRILPKKRTEDRWAILRDYLQDNIRVAKLTAYEYGDFRGGGARSDKTLEDFPATTPEEVAALIARRQAEGVSERSWTEWAVMLPRRAEMLDRETRAGKAKAAAAKRWSKKKAAKRKKSL
jgi:hypothetical protein